MKLTIEGGIFYIDNKRFCFAKVNDNGREEVRLEPRKVSTQYSHAHGKVLPLIADAGWIADDDLCHVRIGSVLGSNGPLKCHMSICGLVARIEACEEFSTPVTLEIK